MSSAGTAVDLWLGDLCVWPEVLHRGLAARVISLPSHSQASALPVGAGIIFLARICWLPLVLLNHYARWALKRAPGSCGKELWLLPGGERLSALGSLPVETAAVCRLAVHLGPLAFLRPTSDELGSAGCQPPQLCVCAPGKQETLGSSPDFEVLSRRLKVLGSRWWVNFIHSLMIYKRILV